MQLCLWSLNPAVAFKELTDKARCVVLTSGTLAPTESFASEVGLPPVAAVAAESVSCMTTMSTIREWVRTWGYLVSRSVGAECSAMGLSGPSNVFARSDTDCVL